MVVAIAVVTTTDFDGEEFAHALRTALGSACPSIIVEMTEIPRNGIGKVRRQELARQGAARLLDFS